MDTRNDSSLYPDFFARFYDVIYDRVRSGADHDFFMGRILAADGPVLEVGVGTGRFFMEALSRGADIYGIDISPEMVKVLDGKLPEKERNRVQVADICGYSDQRRYSLVVAPFRVFMHLTTVEKQLEALASVHKLLVPGGRLIFDLFVPKMKMLSEGLKDHLDFEGEYERGKTVKRYTSMHADPVNQLSHITFRLEWEEDGLLVSRTWHTGLRLFFRYELEHLLERSVFSQFMISGDFEGNPLTASSKEFVVECTA